MDCHDCKDQQYKNYALKKENDVQLRKMARKLQVFERFVYRECPSTPKIHLSCLSRRASLITP